MLCKNNDINLRGFVEHVYFGSYFISIVAVVDLFGILYAIKILCVREKKRKEKQWLDSGEFMFWHWAWNCTYTYSRMRNFSIRMPSVCVCFFWLLFWCQLFYSTIKLKKQQTFWNDRTFWQCNRHRYLGTTKLKTNNNKIVVSEIAKMRKIRKKKRHAKHGR